MKRSLTLAARRLSPCCIAAGCGGTDEVPPDAVAVVDGTPIPKATLDELLTARRAYAAQKQSSRRTGRRSTSRPDAGRRVPRPARGVRAARPTKLDVEVTDARSRTGRRLKKQYFGGDQTKFEAGAQGAGLHATPTLREDTRAQLVSERIFNDVTKDVKVTDAESRRTTTQNRSRTRSPESRESATSS